MSDNRHWIGEGVIYHADSNTTAKKTSSLTLGRTLLKGSAAGVISAIAANLLAWAIMSNNNYEFAMLNGFSITLSAFFVNVFGAFIFRFIQKRSSRAILYYAILSLLMAVLMSLNTSANPMEPNIESVANPLHYTVAILSLVLIPVLMKRK